MLFTPRDLIRKSLPLGGIDAELVGRLVEDCFRTYANDPDHGNLDTHIHAYRSRMLGALRVPGKARLRALK